MFIEMHTRPVIYHTLDYKEWERVVAEVYEVEGWSFIADHESSNDCNHSFTVDGKSLTDWDEKEIEIFKKDYNEVGWITQALLNDMCKRGLVEPGVYLIVVSW